MSKDHSERRTYRKSPGRQYGYEYDPLHSRGEQNQSGPLDSPLPGGRGATRDETGSRSGTPLSQRPDLRRTRQLLRQNILATKARLAEEGGEQEEELYYQETERQPQYEEVEEVSDRRYPTRSGRLVQPRRPVSQELLDVREDGEEWDEEFGDVDPDLGYEEPDPLDVRLGYRNIEPAQPALRRQPIPPRASMRAGRPVEPEEEYYDEDEDAYDDDEYEEVEEAAAPTRRREKKRKKVSRRGLLLGLGAVAVGGAGVAAYEFGPKLPQVVSSAAQDVEKQVADAFQKGLAQGEENIRKQFLTALEDMQGFSLTGAIAAARLTRVAYDVFVAPVIQFGSTLTGDFLNNMLKAFKTARGWLATVYMDNASLIAIQKVLESWVSQVSNMPKQINAIAQTDLDGAQSYLRGLQRMVDEEKAKLNNTQATPTAQATPTVKSTPKAH